MSLQPGKPQARTAVERHRWKVLVLGPLPIVAASMGLSWWAKSPPAEPPAANHVLASSHAQPVPITAVRPARQPQELSAACAALAEQLRARLGGRCQVIVRPPMVLGGDLTADELAAWYEQTIGPASRAMARSYFQTTPDQPVVILLFASEASYNEYARRLFGDEGISVYGYYKRQERTVVLNINTGGGTLVHELTHALVDFDFPAIPDWFNEGLASLHEQCRIRPDESGIDGLLNWRLPGLQQVALQERLPSIEQLIANDDFRGRDVGLNYAQARYLCLFLQQHGLLEAYYRQFRGQQASDPQGLETLRQMFPGSDWAEIDRQFRQWVLQLEPPGKLVSER